MNIKDIMDRDFTEDTDELGFLHCHTCKSGDHLEVAILNNGYLGIGCTDCEEPVTVEKLDPVFFAQYEGAKCAECDEALGAHKH